MAMDDEDGLSFGYRLPKDVTDAVRRAFHKEEASDAGAGGQSVLGPFVYHAEGLTFAFVEHQGPGSGTCLLMTGVLFAIRWCKPSTRSLKAKETRCVSLSCRSLSQKCAESCFWLTCGYVFVVYASRRFSTELECQIRSACVRCCRPTPWCLFYLAF